MAVESTENRLGMALPDRSLPDDSGVSVALRAPGHRATVLAFVCNHCPYVKHVERAFGEMVAEFAPEGLRTLAVVSNDFDSHPEDDVPGMREQKARANWDFPYLIDRDQTLALECGAVCTPDFFVFGESFTLAYRGAFDASSPKNGNPVTGDLMRAAITSVLAGDTVPLPHRPAMGCGIKWSPGNEPESY